MLKSLDQMIYLKELYLVHLCISHSKCDFLGGVKQWTSLFGDKFFLPFHYYFFRHPQPKWGADGVKRQQTFVRTELCDSWSHLEVSRDRVVTVDKLAAHHPGDIKGRNELCWQADHSLSDAADLEESEEHYSSDFYQHHYYFIDFCSHSCQTKAKVQGQFYML